MVLSVLRIQSLLKITFYLAMLKTPFSRTQGQLVTFLSRWTDLQIAALRFRYNAWSYIDIYDKECILKILITRYRRYGSGAGIKEGKPNFCPPETLRSQNPLTSQPSKIDAIRVD